MFFKKIISFMMVLAIVFTATVSDVALTPKAAQSKVWNRKVDTSWFTGDRDRYDISTAEQLAGLAKLVNEMKHEDQFNGITINLTQDIVLNKTNNFKKWNKKAPKNKWTPIGNTGGVTYIPAFAGVFNGNGHKIIGMYVGNAGYGVWGTTSPGGLFGFVCQGAVMNVKLEKAYIKAYGAIGGISACTENSLILNCEVNNTKIEFGDGGAGGVVGSGVSKSWLPAFSFQFFSLGCGIAWNPLLFMGNDTATKFKGTILFNCKASNVSFTKAKKAGGCGSVGGLIQGGADRGVGIANCLAYNNTIKSDGDKGMLTGFVAKGNQNVIVKNSYSCNTKIYKKSKNKKYIDKKTAKKIKKKTMTSAGFAQKLGSGYVYKKGKAPGVLNYTKKEKNTENYTVENGRYTIQLAKDTSRYMTVGAGAKLGAKGQTFELKYNDEGYYFIVDVATNKVLQVVDSAISEAAYDEGIPAQRWLLQKTEDGNIVIVSVLKEKSLTVEKGDTTEGTNVILYDNRADENQKWILVK